MKDPTLSQCLVNFGSAPRKFSLYDRWTYLRVPTPRWLFWNAEDRLTILFKHMRKLFRKGLIVWGHVIQANVLMFENGEDNLPGEVVYSLDHSKEIEPRHLRAISRKLGSLKGTKPNNHLLMPIAEYLTDELIRVFGLAVPPSISPDIQCKISTTLFVRKHLPNRRLCSLLVPLVVNPSEPNVVMTLPERFWPSEFVVRWKAGAAL